MKAIFTITLILLFVQITLSASCGRANPSDASGCANYDTADKTCCFFKNGSDTMCYSIPMTAKATTTSYVVNNITYQVDCSKSTSSITVTSNTSFGGYCALNPTTYKDCSAKSTSSSSCCMTTTNSVNYCIWMGTKVNDATTTIGTRSFSCSSTFIGSMISGIILLFIILL